MKVLVAFCYLCSRCGRTFPKGYGHTPILGESYSPFCYGCFLLTLSCERNLLNLVALVLLCGYI